MVKEFVDAARGYGAGEGGGAYQAEHRDSRRRRIFRKPPFWGMRVLKPQDFDLREIFQYINETALFKNQWQLKTASQEDYGRLVETKYRPILKELEEEVIAAGWFEPKVVYGYFAAQSEGNDVIVYDCRKAGSRAIRFRPEALRFTFPRQREGRELCISDFFAAARVRRQDGCDRHVAASPSARGFA